MSSRAIYEIVDAEKLHVLVLAIGAGNCRAVSALRSRFSWVEQDEGAIQYITINPSNETLTESSVNTTLWLDCGRLQLDGQGMPSSVSLDYLRSCIGESFQQADAIFIMADFRDEQCVPVAGCLSSLLSTKTISRQRFVVAILNEPPYFEQPMPYFETGRALLRQHCDAVIVNPFRKTGDHLHQAKRPLSHYFELETQAIVETFGLFANCFWIPGLICIDFADVYAVLSEMGEGIFVCGQGRGEHRVQLATDQAIAELQQAWEDLGNPDIGGVLADVSGGEYSVKDFDEVMNILCSHFSTSTRIKIGTTLVPEMVEDELLVRVLAVKDKAAEIQSRYGKETAIQSVDLEELFRDDEVPTSVLRRQAN